jgi:hypothetical protein
MRKGQELAGVVRGDQASSASTFRKLDDAFLQVSFRGFSLWFRLCGLADGGLANGTVRSLSSVSPRPSDGRRTWCRWALFCFFANRCSSDSWALIKAHVICFWCTGIVLIQSRGYMREFY